MSQPSLLYAYAIVATTEGAHPLASILGASSGIDALPVAIVDDERSGDAPRMSVLVSAVDAGLYEPEMVETRVGELSWLAPRAEAHDRVVTAAADRAQVIPLPIFTLFRDEQAVRSMLADRRSELARLFARLRGAREYTVRLYRDDARLSLALAELSPRIRELETSAAKASPGQRYLLQRKIDEERRSELRKVSSETARTAYAVLLPLARAAVREPIPASIAGADPVAAGNTQQAILNASFLVEDERLDAFRRKLSEEIALREPAGFRFEFTGPWPAYHFARESGAISEAPSDV